MVLLRSEQKERIREQKESIRDRRSLSTVLGCHCVRCRSRICAAVVEVKAVLPPRSDAQHVGSSILRQQWPGRLVVANLLKCLLVDQDHLVKWSLLGPAVASWSSVSETNLKARDSLV